MVDEKTVKRFLGFFKTEIRKAGAVGGDAVAVKFGDRLNDPRWRDISERAAGFVTEWLEGQFSGHPILGPATSAVSDVIEQAMPRIWGKDRTRAGGSRRERPDGTTSPSTETPDWVTEWWKSARIRLGRAIKEGGVDFDATPLAQLLRDEFDVLWGAYQGLVEVSTPEEPEPVPTHYDETWPKGELLELAKRVGARVYESWTRAKLVEAIDKKLGITREPEREPVDLREKLDGARDKAREVAERVDVAADRLGSRIGGWLERNTDDEGVLRPREEWT